MDAGSKPFDPHRSMYPPAAAECGFAGSAYLLHLVVDDYWTHKNQNGSEKHHQHPRHDEAGCQLGFIYAHGDSSAEPRFVCVRTSAERQTRASLSASPASESEPPARSHGLSKSTSPAVHSCDQCCRPSDVVAPFKVY